MNSLVDIWLQSNVDFCIEWLSTLDNVAIPFSVQANATARWRGLKSFPKIAYPELVVFLECTLIPRNRENISSLVIAPLFKITTIESAPDAVTHLLYQSKASIKTLWIFLGPLWKPHCVPNRSASRARASLSTFPKPEVLPEPYRALQTKQPWGAPCRYDDEQIFASFGRLVQYHFMT